MKRPTLLGYQLVLVKRATNAVRMSLKNILIPPFTSEIFAFSLSGEVTASLGIRSAQSESRVNVGLFVSYVGVAGSLLPAILR
jgi:hypothetical protein